MTLSRCHHSQENSNGEIHRRENNKLTRSWACREVTPGNQEIGNNIYRWQLQCSPPLLRDGYCYKKGHPMWVNSLPAEELDSLPISALLSPFTSFSIVATATEFGDAEGNAFICIAPLPKPPLSSFIRYIAGSKCKPCIATPFQCWYFTYSLWDWSLSSMWKSRKITSLWLWKDFHAKRNSSKDVKVPSDRVISD